MRPCIALALAFTFAAVAGPALAQHDEPAPAPEPRRSELPESVLRAERETGGQVLRAEPMQRDGREVYRLKVLTPDGRVRIMREDPRERRRDAWRDSRRDAVRESFDEGRRVDQHRMRASDRARATPPPAELDMPETLPPERGDRH